MAEAGLPTLSFVADRPITKDVVRRRNQILLIFFAALVSLALSLGLIPVVGRVYSPNDSLKLDSNGALTNRGQLAAIMLIIYFGTLSVVLLVNFLPSLAVLNLKPIVYCFIIFLMWCGATIGMVLCLVYLIEPQKTFSGTLNVSDNDPILSTIGAYFCIAFGFLAILCVGIFRATANMPSFMTTIKRRMPDQTKTWKWRMIGFVALFLLLG